VRTPSHTGALCLVVGVVPPALVDSPPRSCSMPELRTHAPGVRPVLSPGYPPGWISMSSLPALLLCLRREPDLRDENPMLGFRRWWFDDSPAAPSMPNGMLSLMRMLMCMLCDTPQQLVRQSSQTQPSEGAALQIGRSPCQQHGCIAAVASDIEMRVPVRHVMLSSVPLSSSWAQGRDDEATSQARVLILSTESRHHKVFWGAKVLDHLTFAPTSLENFIIAWPQNARPTANPWP
jgi:hypothetical protein